MARAIVPAYLLSTEHLRPLRFLEPMYDVDALLAVQVYSAHELCFYTGFQVDEWRCGLKLKSGLKSWLTCGFTDRLRSTFWYGLKFGLMIGLGSGLRSGFKFGFMTGLMTGLRSGLRSGLTSELMTGLRSGLTSVLIAGWKSSGLKSGLRSGLGSELINCVSGGNEDGSIGACWIRPSLHDGQLLFAQDPGGLPKAFNFLFQEVLYNKQNNSTILWVTNRFSLENLITLTKHSWLSSFSPNIVLHSPAYYIPPCHVVTTSNIFWQLAKLWFSAYFVRHYVP